MPYPFRNRLTWLAAASALLLGGAALAERADRDQPMNIEADSLRYDDQQQTSTFTGKVLVTKGSIVMRGGRLQVSQDRSGHQKAVMTGEGAQRAFFRQKRDGVDEHIEGEAEALEYDGAADTVRLLRRAEMRRTAGAAVQDRVSGSAIVYNNRTGVYTVDGGAAAGAAPSAAPGGRVRATLAPRSGQTQTQTPAPAALPLRATGAPGAPKQAR